MKCDDVLEVLHTAEGEAPAPAERRLAEEHLRGCRDCQAAHRATRALALMSDLPVPEPVPGALERAVLAGTGQAAHAARRSAGRLGRGAGFWLGAAVGGSVAAGLTLAAVLALRPGAPTLQPGASQAGEPRVSTPQVTVAANESRGISIALDSPEALAGAEIRVLLTGAIGLVGFEGRKELAWRTDLDRGANRLTLPIVALGTEGGQVVVEVHHEDKRKRFLVDINTVPPDDSV